MSVPRKFSQCAGLVASWVYNVKKSYTSSTYPEKVFLQKTLYNELDFPVETGIYNCIIPISYVYTLYFHI